jgi:hypothetical protein
MNLTINAQESAVLEEIISLKTLMSYSYNQTKVGRTLSLPKYHTATKNQKETKDSKVCSVVRTKIKKAHVNF